ncbi:MAG: YcjX family protein [Pseudomonadota bacterium]
MVIQTTTDIVTRSVSGTASALGGLFGDHVVRMGVTGLSRAGKTVFITSLVANLLNRGRMPQLVSAADGSIQAAYLQPQPDDTVARFDYETHLDSLIGPNPAWPEGTSAVSELRLSLRLRPRGLLGGLQGPKTVHLDIIDYPGEWLLDLGLLDIDYDTWSEQSLATAQKRSESQAFLDVLATVSTDQKFDDVTAAQLADAYAQYLQAARQNGFANCTPGRFLLPGELAGSPALTFAPLPNGPAGRRSLRAEMARRFEAYKSRVVRPFFRNHFAKIDRQIVLVDVLKALANGPEAVSDLETAMGNILTAFRPGRNGVFTEMLLGKRVDRILFAATKADHLHHSQHGALTDLVSDMTAKARDRASFSGAKTQAMSLAALRTTTETTIAGDLPAVQGVDVETDKARAFYPGELPTSPAALLAQARQGGDDWGGPGFATMRFGPPKMTISQGEGPPHIRMDKAMQFLIGDKL